MIMSKKDLAEVLKVTTQTIDRYEKRGMPVMRPEGCDPRYMLEDVIEWMKGNPKDEPKEG